MTLEHLSKANFNEKTNSADHVVVVDFFATWCGPCKMLGKVLEELGDEQDDFKIVKVDIDQNRDLTREWNISTVPSVFMIKDGEVKDSAVGFLPKAVLTQKMQNL